MSACLMLHGIGAIPDFICPEERPYWISEETFDFVIAEAKQNGARITFDDGNETDATIALPKLAAQGLTATFFIPSDRIGTTGYVSEQQIRDLHAAGMEIGSHGCSHLNWLHASDPEVASDVTRSVERLSQIIAAPVRSVAIPYGHCDRRVLAVLRRLGIGEVHSSFRGPQVEGAWLIRRDCITAALSHDDIREILTRDPGAATAVVNTLRIWRRAGNAAIWTA